MSRRRRSRALIVVDVQNDFCEGGSLAVPNASEIISKINQLKSDEYEWKLIVLTQDWHPTGHSSFASTHSQTPFMTINLKYGPQTLWPDHCVQNSSGAEFHRNLRQSKADIIVRKGTNHELDSYSAFWDNGHIQETGLTKILRDNDISDVYICGLATDFCVGFTALDATEAGFRTYLVQDACRGIADHSVKAMLDRCRKAGVNILATANVKR